MPEYITRGVFDFMFGIEAKVRQIQEEANIQAAATIGRLHDALKEEGIYEEHELRLFITRLLFLFFADDSAVFRRNYLFQDFLENCKEADTLGDKLNQLFEFLNTPDQKRSKTQSEKFKGFEYVNGGLFKERLRTFDFTAKQHRALIDCGNFDWRNISPEIFGTLFQSVMDAQERREAGAHYTEAANIDKVINGLFLENLRAEFEAVKALKRDKAKKLAAFYQKIQNLQFLDPACGCGNFLIVAYDRIRALEDDIIAEALKDKADGLFDSPSVQCRLKQFHGIEIDEFAVLIARTAMWLKNHQCNIRTQIRFDGEVACHTLPLEDAAEIIHANSLRTPWQAADYIFGNPPLYRLDLPNQRAEKRPRKHLRPYQRLRPVGLRLQLVRQSRRHHGAASPSSDGICFHQFHLPRPAGRNPLGQPFKPRHRNPLCPPHLPMDEPSRRQSRRPLHHRRLPPKAANAV